MTSLTVTGLTGTTLSTSQVAPARSGPSRRRIEPGGNFTITNGQGGPGAGLVVPTIFLFPDLPGVVFVEPDRHPEVVGLVETGKDSTKTRESGDAEPTRIATRNASSSSPCRPDVPDSAVADPALEAVKILVDNVNFPPSASDVRGTPAKRSDRSIVDQIRTSSDVRRRVVNRGAVQRRHRPPDREYRVTIPQGRPIGLCTSQTGSGSQRSKEAQDHGTPLVTPRTSRGSSPCADSSGSRTPESASAR